MPRERVVALLERGSSWGRRWPQHEPLLLAECVPGGTSTALAVLLGLGLAAEGLVSGSLRQPAHGLKSCLAHLGLAAGAIEIAPGAPADGVDPLAVLAAVGDPMQALAAGLTLAASARGVPVLLAGGSQMAAVLALALALAPAHQRQRLANQAVVATTAWLAEEPNSDLAALMALISGRWQVEAQLAVASLRFHHCRSQALRDYERGYVKEGVGAGGFALLWELSGRAAADLAALCDADCERLLNGPRLGGA
jgi:NaMN:DMB phosphoribosyltransferase